MATIWLTQGRGAATWSADIPHRHIDVTAYLTLWLVLLFGISARQVVGPLGAIGTPALLMAMASALWWSASRVVPGLDSDQRLQPVRIAIFVYAWYMLATFAVAHSRQLTALERTGALRAAITVVALSGLALVVADGVTSRDRLRLLMRRLATAGAVLAFLGLLEFFLGVRVNFGLPGLDWNQPAVGLGSRSLFNRPAATAMHPIEFSVMVAALLPVAIHFALCSPRGTSERNNAVTKVVIIALAVPLSLSRSGLVAFLAAMIVLAAGWTWRRRAYGLGILLASVPLLWLLIPGLVGTLTGLFTNNEADPSIQARIDRAPRVMALIRERPWFGRGNGTYSIEDYFLVDNEFFVTTIETGRIGIVLTLALLIAAIITALWAGHGAAAGEETRHLAHAIAAGIAAIGVSLFTFDAFHYHILTGVLFVLIGAAGALWRLSYRDRAA